MNKIVKRRSYDIAPVFDPKLHPLLQRIYALRGLKETDELVYSAKSLLSYEDLDSIESAAEILYQYAFIGKQPVYIVGDFDADGATSTALLMKCLRTFGATQLSYLVPDRFKDGYGLSESIVMRIYEKGGGMIITVDNGISSVTGVALAKSLGIKVIITDHHLPGAELPGADAIVNPNLANCLFPSKHLAGVGVAFYFMLALRAYLRKQRWFEYRSIAEPPMTPFLDLVALGTVADVVTLDRNNRILVHLGLCRLKQDKACVGIKALLPFIKKKNENITASDVSYLLAPRLNAAGRMVNMAIGVELLLTENKEEAQKIAATLDALNNERRQIEKTMQKDALASIVAIEQDLDIIPAALVIYQSDWHQGIIGIIASRIKEKYYRPVIAFAKADEIRLRGSGRSIAGFHLKDALERINTKNPGLIETFGGHAMAAGLTVAKENLTTFKRCFTEIAEEKISQELFHHVILSDGSLPNDYFTLEVADLIRHAGPWGHGFQEPLFDGDFILLSQRLIDEKHLRIRVKVEPDGPLLDGIAFNVDRQFWPNPAIKKVRLAYQLDINEFRGQKKVQLLIRHLWTGM